MRKLELSSYYPPRARWYSPLFRITAAIRRIAWLDRIHLPEGISWAAFITALLIPGFAFWVRRERMLAAAVIAAYALLVLVFLIWLGFTVGNIAFGLMLSLHVTGIVFLLNPWLAGSNFGFRLLMGVAVLAVVGGLLYAPLRGVVQDRWLMPLRVNGAVVIVQTVSSPAAIRRGDWIAYSIASDREREIFVQAGLALRPVLGVAGDRIRFTPDACEVNGVASPRQPRMPVSGDLVVPEKHWFIWPNLAINMHGNIPAATTDAMLLKLASVEQGQFVGKPFTRWFWRPQILP